MTMGSWERVRLKQVARINPFTRMPKAGAVDFFPMEALIEGGGLVRGEIKPASDAGGYSQLANGDVVFAKVTPCFENMKCALVAGLERGVGLATTEVIVFRPNRRVVPKFLLYRLQARDFHKFGISLMRGVGGLKRVPDRSVGAFEFDLPTIDEQKAIVELIEAEADLLKRRSAAFDRKREVLVEAKSALREAAVFGRERPGRRSPSEAAWHGELPARWGVERIGDLFREAARPGREGLPVLSVSIHSGISDRELGDDEGARKVARSEDKSLYKRVRRGDLVYNQMRAWQGGFGVAAVDGLVSPAYVVAAPKRGVNSAFVEHVLRSPSAIEEMRRRSRGIIDFRLRLYWDEFKDILVPVPPPDEQEKIVQELSNRLSLVDRQVKLLDDAQEALGDQRSALINDVVTGVVPVPVGARRDQRPDRIAKA
jgi:type I restriction enzyme S subunit